PERFTLEFDLTGGGNAMTIAFVDPPSSGRAPRIEINAHTGWLYADPIDAEGSLGLDTNERQVHIAIAVDGQHVKMYANEKRVFNAPNADIGRSNQIRFNLNGWSDEHPRMIANVRIAAGGKELYDALAS